MKITNSIDDRFSLNRSNNEIIITDKTNKRAINTTKTNFNDLLLKNVKAINSYYYYSMKTYI